MGSTAAVTRKKAVTIDQATFYRGLLFGLRIHRGHFTAEGADFHRAFVLTVEHAKQTAPRRSLLRDLTIRVDPIFGVCREASEMLLEGEQDRVLSLMNPDLEKAQFKIHVSDAKIQLKRLPEAKWFERLGRFFAQQLR
jgi:hypothetical protein